MMDNKKQVTDLDSWYVENIRLTGFSSSMLALEDNMWWRDLVGEEPDSSELRSKQGFRKDEGVYEDNSLVLTVQPDRVDWVYTSKPGEEPRGLPTVGPFGECAKTFAAMMDRWFDIAPPLSRLAFGAVLLRRANSRREAYSDLAKFLPSVRLNPQGSFDFIYQINRPRDSVILANDHVSLNRLSKWSVVVMRRIQLPSSANREAVHTIVPGWEVFASRLELDVNTIPEFTGTLSQSLLSPLFHELMELGFAIAASGDIE